MSRCLSRRALLRMVAGAERPAQRAHVAACGRCAAALGALAADLTRVDEVLLHGEPPARRERFLRRYWVPAGAAAVALVTLLVGAEVWLWRAVTPAPAPGADEVAVFLDQISATMFSAGAPARTVAGEAADLDFIGTDDTAAASCDEDVLSTGCDGAANEVSDNVLNGDEGRRP